MKDSCDFMVVSSVVVVVLLVPCGFCGTICMVNQVLSSGYLIGHLLVVCVG